MVASAELAVQLASEQDMSCMARSSMLGLMTGIAACMSRQQAEEAVQGIFAGL